MSEEKEREGEFDPEIVREIEDRLSEHSLALRAFGVLLRSSDLSDFADQTLADTLKSDDFDRYNLRWGLQQIIELYLARQERILAEYVDKYLKSDFNLIKRAEIGLRMVEQGAFKSKEGAINNLREAITDLDVVILRGGELKGKAEEIRQECLKIMNELKEPVLNMTKGRG